LKLDGDGFKQKYGFQKPSFGDEVVGHCKAGMRAQNGAKAFLDAGFTNVRYATYVLMQKLL